MADLDPWGAERAASGYPRPQSVPEPVSTGHVVLAWAVALVTGFYMLPWAIAATRRRQNTVTIALVDLLLGWTVVGWVVALVMAFGNDGPRVLPAVGAAPPGWYPDGSGGRRWWDGTRWTEHGTWEG